MAIDGVANRLGLLFTGERDSLSLGVARKQLVIEGVATDPHNPVLKELAQRLHKHHVGALKFQRGITRDELADALSALAVDATRSEKPLGLDRQTVSERWHHVHFFPLTYDRLQLIEDEPDGEETRQHHTSTSRSTQLWIGLARAALVTDAANAATTPDEEADDSAAFEPATVAKAIDEHQREQAYDQVIVGYLLQIGEELKTAEGPEAAGLQRRVSRLVASLKDSTLERLLEMGGDKSQRRKFLLDASQGVTVEAVVDLVKAASQAEGQTVSHSMLRMLSKLAHHPSARGAPQTRANPVVRDVMKRLIDDWSLDDPNPEAYRAVLESMVKPGGDLAERTSVATECEPERLVQIGIEVGAFGPQVREAMNTLRKTRRYDVLLDLVEKAPSAEAGAPIAEFLKQEQIFAELLSQERVDFALAGRYARRTGASAAIALLDAVSTVEDAKARVPYFELLESLGDEIGPEAASRLPISPPPIQRELLALLGRMPVLPEGFSARPYLRHADPVVRREAVRLLLKDPAARDATILAALADADNRVVFSALAAAQEGCQPTCIELIRKRVDRGDFDAQLRTMGIRIVARLRSAPTLDWLLGFVVAEARWPLRPRLRPATPEMLAALGEVAALWPDDSKAAVALNLARHSKDPEVRSKLDRARSRGAT